MSGPDRIYLQDAGDYESAADFEVTWCVDKQDDADTEYIRRDPAVLAALLEVQALTAAAEARALAGVTTLHTVIADIRAATVGSKPMLSELAQALVAWRDEAVRAEREACARLVDCGCDNSQKAAVIEAKTSAERARACGQYNCGAEDADAIRKRGEG